MVQISNHVTPHLLLMDEQEDEKHQDNDGNCLIAVCHTNNKQRNEIEQSLQVAAATKTISG